MEISSPTKVLSDPEIDDLVANTFDYTINLLGKFPHTPSDFDTKQLGLQVSMLSVAENYAIRMKKLIKFKNKLEDKIIEEAEINFDRLTPIQVAGLHDLFRRVIKENTDFVHLTLERYEMNSISLKAELIKKSLVTISTDKTPAQLSQSLSEVLEAAMTRINTSNQEFTQK